VNIGSVWAAKSLVGWNIKKLHNWGNRRSSRGFYQESVFCWYAALIFE
jgi:hypothetical protein